VIKPTIGRVVLFHRERGDEPYPALVAYVHSDTCINVGGFTHGGSPFCETSVPLLQDDEPAPEVGYYAEWMPYQKGQAAKEAGAATA
jgi:hypothetical protein